MSDIITSISPEDLTRLETAANILMASPDQVTAEQRKEAENFYLDLQNTCIKIEACSRLLESTSNHFVMFEISRIFARNVLRQWHSFTEDDVMNICNYLLNFPAQHLELPNFVITEIVRSAAVILKRGSVDYEILDSEFLSTTIENFMTNADEKLQAIGLQIIETISMEFISSWYSSDISLTWDFHLRANKLFENILLKKFLKLSLSTLSNIIPNANLSNELDVKICDSFLRVALIVFSWDFSSRTLSRVKVSSLELKCNSFRPPVSWLDLFQTTEILTFFSELHKRVRLNEDLAISSLNCFSQLASLIGEALESSTKHVASQTGQAFHDIYIRDFVKNLIEIFSETIYDYEMTLLASTLYRLFTYHSFSYFLRFSPLEYSNLIEFISNLIFKLTSPALSIALRNSDITYIPALQHLFQVWRTIMRNYNLYREDASVDICSINGKILECFMKSVLTPPFGERQQPTEDREIVEENQADEDDREMFNDLLSDIAFFSLHSLDAYLNFIHRGIRTLILHFQRDSEAATLEDIRNWQENLHWLFMLLEFHLQQTDSICDTNLPQKLALRVLNGLKSGEFVRINFEDLINSCLNQPADIERFPENLDPVSMSAALTICWFLLEHNALEQLKTDSPLISPELIRSTLWLFGRIVASLTPRETLQTRSNSAITPLQLDILPVIPLSGSLANSIIEITLRKVFTIITIMTGEEALCADAIRLIINIAENRSEALGTCQLLYDLFLSLNIEDLPCRRELIKSLVFIGSVINSSTIQRRMHDNILLPLQKRFFELSNASKVEFQPNSEEKIIDFLECFCGIAQAGQHDSANILFNYLHDVIIRSVELIDRNSNSQPFINVVLKFFSAIAEFIYFYLDLPKSCQLFQTQLLKLVKAYRDTQLKMLIGGNSLELGDLEEENFLNGIVTMVEILNFSVSKIFNSSKKDITNEEGPAFVVLSGIEILIPLLNENSLKIPKFCENFFRLLLSLADLELNIMLFVNENLMANILHGLEFALDETFGKEVLKYALDTLHNIAIQCGQSENPPSYTRSLIPFTNKLFETSLRYSSQEDILPSACNALYTLICLDKSYFNEYVNKLLTNPQNAPNVPQLSTSFNSLLADENFDLVADRMQKRTFHNKMEKFLEESKGILCLI